MGQFGDHEIYGEAESITAPTDEIRKEGKRVGF